MPAVSYRGPAASRGGRALPSRRGPRAPYDSAAMSLYPVLLAVHVLSLLLWVGGLVSIARLVALAAAAESTDARGALGRSARALYRSVASPWMGFALLTGLGMIGALHGEQFKHGWFHGKFTLALVMLALHFVLGARVRRVEAQGATEADGGWARTMSLVVMALAAATVFCAIVLKAMRP